MNRIFRTELSLDGYACFRHRSSDGITVRVLTAMTVKIF